MYSNVGCGTRCGTRCKTECCKNVASIGSSSHMSQCANHPLPPSRLNCRRRMALPLRARCSNSRGHAQRPCSNRFRTICNNAAAAWFEANPCAQGGDISRVVRRGMVFQCSMRFGTRAYSTCGEHFFSAAENHNLLGPLHIPRSHSRHSRDLLGSSHTPHRTGDETSAHG